MLSEAIGEAEAVHVVVAWAQASGITPMADEIRGLRERGGTASIVLGVDGGIATRESLELAVDLFDRAVVFHDTGSRLFHPKLYCVEAPGRITVALGSSNLTGGGLYRNYEANVVLRLAPDSPEDRDLYAKVQAFRAALVAEGMPHRPLTHELIDTLAEEETLVTSAPKRKQAERVAHAKAASIAKDIFGGPVSGLPGAPASSPPTEVESDEGIPTPGESSEAAATLRWWKELTPSDVLRKPESSHQRNYVALSKAGHEIDFKTWFRQELFGGLDWSAQTMHTGNLKEVTLVPFEVVVDGESVGTYELRVDHAEARIANQNNSPTYLNWSGMIELIRASDFRHWWLELARLEDQTFRLRLSREEPA